MAIKLQIIIKGIYTMFCGKMERKVKKKPIPPFSFTKNPIVNPKEKPLKNMTPIIKGIPMTVSPKNPIKAIDFNCCK